MKRNVIIGIAFFAGLALAAGYWWGHSAATRDAAPVTGKDAGGQPRRILYYRNPMGYDDTSPVPKKDAMGMDYVPVYADDAPEGPQVKISPDRLQTLGVRSTPAAERTMSHTIRAVGTVEASERGLYTVSPKFEGWITTLFVNTTGATVRRGQPLLAVYSPELVTAQEEYRIAVEALKAMAGASPEARAGMQAIVDGGLQRLRNWDIADADLAELKAGKEARESLPLRARTDGVVIEMMARAGMRFMPGEPLFQIADLSKVWIVARVFEQDLGYVRPGQKAVVSVTAYPGRTFTGQVTFVYPTVEPETRTARVRIELSNEAGLLKPDLYGTVEIQAGESVAAVAIPESAVLDSGTRQVVLIDIGGGAFEPREVELGSRGDGYVEVVKGLDAGQRVVVNGNFLIDAESNLKAALESLGGHGEH
ncbi:MAG TPA: efflux RND transporter periplasmic adaptor subunit [Steroidobacteraceae bacterium]|nr:efflux RND transporter periplasmic adaptor subunit [Steroidobacteraceae bacterium]